MRLLGTSDPLLHRSEGFLLGFHVDYDSPFASCWMLPTLCVCVFASVRCRSLVSFVRYGFQVLRAVFIADVVRPVLLLLLSHADRVLVFDSLLFTLRLRVHDGLRLIWLRVWLHARLRSMLTLRVLDVL